MWDMLMRPSPVDIRAGNHSTRITATTMESTTQQHLISSPVLSWLFIQHHCQWWRNVKIQGETHCVGSGIIWARIVASIQIPDLFSVIYPRSYHVFRPFSLRCSQNLYDRRTLEKNEVFFQFPKFLQCHEVPKSLYTLSVKSSLFENLRLI